MERDLTVAQALVTTLRDLGTRHLFGVSGANIEHLHDAVEVHAPEIENVLCKSEFGAAFMADGYARQGLHPGAAAAPTLGVCCSTSGGGMMNLAVGIAESRASAIPVLGIVGLTPSPLWGQGGFQDASGGETTIDGLALWRAIAKHAVVVTPDGFWKELRVALAECVNGYRGPSVLLIPRNIMEQPVGARPDDFPETLAQLVVECPVDFDSLSALLGDLKAARSPVMVVGPEAQGDRRLLEVAEQCRIPVATTLASPGAFSNHSPAYAGMIGVAGHPRAHDAVAQSDLVLAIGTQLQSMDRAPVEALLQGKRIWIVHRSIAVMPSALGPRGLCMNANRFISVLHRVRAEYVKSGRAPLAAPLYRQPKLVDPADETRPGLGTRQGVLGLQPYLAHYQHVFMDAGNCAASAAHYLQMPAEARSTIALGMGGMGYAICASIGSQLAAPSDRTLVICGDGAFLMCGMEVHTAIERQLPMLWVIFNDGQHGMCTSRQRFFFGERLTCARYAAVDFGQIVRGLAKGRPLWTRSVDNLETLEQALEIYHSLPAPIPGVLEVNINKEEVPPFFPLSQYDPKAREREVVPKTIVETFQLPRPPSRNGTATYPTGTPGLPGREPPIPARASR